MTSINPFITQKRHLLHCYRFIPFMSLSSLTQNAIKQIQIVQNINEK